MIFADITSSAANAAVGLSLVSLAIFIFAILLIVAPLAIWHHVAKRRDEAHRQNKQVVAMLNQIAALTKSVNDTLADICDAIESHK